MEEHTLRYYLESQREFSNNVIQERKVEKRKKQMWIVFNFTKMFDN